MIIVLTEAATPDGRGSPVAVNFSMVRQFKPYCDGVKIVFDSGAELDVRESFSEVVDKTRAAR